MIKDLTDDELLNVHGGGFWGSIGDFFAAIDPVAAAVKILSYDWLNPAKAGDWPSDSGGDVTNDPQGLHGGFDNPANGGLLPSPDGATYPSSGPDISPS